ncbi:MAG: hypothetical protein ACI9N0_002078 [Ilumatobacter sp.]|jgi:hypothetical protein
MWSTLRVGGELSAPPVRCGVTERLDPDAAARVLRRAHEIEDDFADPAEVAVDAGGVSPSALIEAADEVGINPDAVRDALALERFDASMPQRRRLDRLVGPAAIVVEHVVSRTPSDALDGVEQWLTTAHRMRCVTDRDGRVECRPRSGLGASLGRTLNSFTGDVNIRAVERMTVEVAHLHLGATPTEPRTLVRVVADRAPSRARRIGGGSTAGLVGVGVAAASVASAAPLLSVASIGVFIGGYLFVRSGSARADKVELELLRVVMAVDRSEKPAGLVSRATRRVGGVVRDTMNSRPGRR